MKTKRLWAAFIGVLVISFGVIGYYGYEIYREKPPIPEKVVSVDGTVIFTKEDIMTGQNVWQSIGGQQVGTVWGHGAYVAPDWSADWLHKEAMYILNLWANEEYGVSYDELDPEIQAGLNVRIQKELRTNTYDAGNGTLVVSEERAKAIAEISKYYEGLFMNDPSKADERVAYAIPENSIKDIDRMHKMNAFFFWAQWACVTERPGKDVSYTNNWPSDKLVGNTPSSTLHFWTGLSILLLLAGIGLLAFYHARSKSEEIDKEKLPKTNPLLAKSPTPSMKATLKYLWVVVGLILVQILTGAITAHYGVEGGGFFGLNLDLFLPYAISRTWHVQLAIFWIATSWLAAGLYFAPAISGHEPKFQRLGVNFLFISLLVIVIGSLIGEWMGVMQKLGLDVNFWFGHQGYEYVELGRFWQSFLFVGLILWLILMIRPMLPALKQNTENRQLLIMYVIAAVAIALFYGAGLMWGQHSHLSVVEYWRWWVVHLWVEGFFEVFATVVVAFLFVQMGLLNVKYATTASLFATIIFLTGGIIGTFHHLYFAGTPTAVLALGASFSALEVVPLVLVGFEAWNNLKLSRATEWVKEYKWPIYFLIAVAFWNMVGAGLFGFMINPPSALYYMQGLNTTPVHGHTALFGVYGMLGIGLMLFVIKGIRNKYPWKTKALKISFWTINIGLMLMVLISLLPVGVMQVIASIKHGMWYARSAEFMQDPTLQMLRWLRLVGDVIFAVGALALAWFIAGLEFGWSYKKSKTE